MPRKRSVNVAKRQLPQISRSSAATKIGTSPTQWMRHCFKFRQRVIFIFAPRTPVDPQSDDGTRPSVRANQVWAVQLTGKIRRCRFARFPSRTRRRPHHALRRWPRRPRDGPALLSGHHAPSESVDGRDRYFRASVRSGKRWIKPRTAPADGVDSGSVRCPVGIVELSFRKFCNKAECLPLRCLTTNETNGSPATGCFFSPQPDWRLNNA